MATFPEKVDVIGTGISATTLRDVVEHILSPPPEGLIVAIANVHSVMTARKNPLFARALAEAEIATTDGVPLAWALRWLGHERQERVAGLPVHLATIEAGLPDGVGHYFYGSTPETLGRMERNLKTRFPQIKITGMYSPPFGPIDPGELERVLSDVRGSGTRIVWVGLGAPKQEVWMHEVRSRLPGITLVGVGAVYDWMAGNVSVAPEWMQTAGLEWLFRLIKEPRRLWDRYLFNNPAYLILVGKQVIVYQWRHSNLKSSA